MFKEILEYAKNTKSFHMPGHKNNKLNLNESLYLADVTEVRGTDDLHHAKGSIKELQERISAIYGSHKSYLMVNGSTGGIMAAISSVTKDHDTVIIGRNCHKSVYNSVLLNRLKVDYIYPQIQEESGIHKGISIDDLVEVERGKEIRAVVVTSPTYEGLVSDIKAIARWAHGLGAVLIVDEAHGAHFTFSDKLPESALELGADMVIQSTHKTLPCLTQTAVFHISEEAVQEGRLSISRLEKYLSIYQSSSPSYVLMSSIEVGIDYMEKHRLEMDALIEDVQELKRIYSESPEGEWLHEPGMDPLRLTYRLKTDKMTGWELEKELRDMYHMQVELASKSYMVAIVTIADSKEEVEELMVRVRDLVQAWDKGHKTGKKSGYHDTVQGICQCSMYEADCKEYERIPMEEGIGRVSHEFIIPYPPGIPLVVPGEIISQEMVERVSFLLNKGHEVYGIIKGEVDVLIERGIE